MTRRDSSPLAAPLLAMLLGLSAPGWAADPPVSASTTTVAPAISTAPDRETLLKNIDAAKREVERLEKAGSKSPDDLPMALLRLGAAYEALPETAAQAQPSYDSAKELWRDAPPTLGANTGPGYAAGYFAAKNRPLARQLYLLAADVAVRAGPAAVGSRTAYNAFKNLGRFALQDAADCPDADAAVAAYLAGAAAGKANQDTIDLVRLRGQLNLKMGKFQAASALFQQAIASYNDNRIAEPQLLRLLREDDISVYYRSGRNQEADRLVEELDRQSGILPKRPPDPVKDLARAGRLDDAVEQAKRDLARLTAPPAPAVSATGAPLPPPAKPSPVAIAAAKARIADLLHGQKKFEEAEGYYLEALSEDKVAADPRLADLRSSWEVDLGQLYRAMGNYAKALDYQQRACFALQLTHESDYPDVLVCLSELAFLNAATGRRDQAEHFYRLLLDTAKRSAPEDKALAAGYAKALADLQAARK